MKRFIFRFILVLFVLVLVGGVGWLALTEPAPPRQEMEKVISNDRFDL